MNLRLISVAAILPLLVTGCSESGQEQVQAEAPVDVNDAANVAERAAQVPPGGFSARPAGGGVAPKPEAADKPAADEEAADEVAADEAAAQKSRLALTYFTIPG